eukprot:4381955-Prymnesium_polylepis.1
MRGSAVGHARCARVGGGLSGAGTGPLSIGRNTWHLFTGPYSNPGSHSTHSGSVHWLDSAHWALPAYTGTG